MNLNTFFKENNKIALAFSGGTDSAFLLWSAIENGADVTAFFVKSAFQPQFELDDANRLAEDLGAKLVILELNPLADEKVARNEKDRCYHCKNTIFSAILNAAKEHGYEAVCDGTNASDDENDRPGMVALKEMKVLSPLRICGITKAQVREFSRKAGLFTYDKPSYACLATRIETGCPITIPDLEKVEKSEYSLMELGFSDFRIRLRNGDAVLQLRQSQFPLFSEKRGEIIEKLNGTFNNIYLDLNTRAEEN